MADHGYFATPTAIAGVVCAPAFLVKVLWGRATARFACTPVDAGTGEFVVRNAENPADLERAVASS